MSPTNETNKKVVTKTVADTLLGTDRDNGKTPGVVPKSDPMAIPTVPKFRPPSFILLDHRGKAPTVDTGAIFPSLDPKMPVVLAPLKRFKNLYKGIPGMVSPTRGSHGTVGVVTPLVRVVPKSGSGTVKRPTLKLAHFTPIIVSFEVARTFLP